MGLDAEFWHGRRVFITGHTGFKGGWLTLWLRQLGAEVTGYALEPSTTPNLFDSAKVAQDIRSVIGDIRDYDRFSQVLRQSAPEIVLHLAAQPLVRESYIDPIGTYATNVMGTVHLLNALREIRSCRSVLVVTSDKCYENREWEYPYREIDRLGGHDPYSSSKGCAEIVTEAFRKSYFPKDANICVGSARAGNVIGGGDWSKDRLLTDTVRALVAGEEILIRNPSAERPWQHVLEPVYGYLRWAELSFTRSAGLACAWNFGPDAMATKPVSWLVERACKLWGEGARWRLDQASHPHEAMLLRLDSSKAERSLGWRGTLNIEQTLQWTLDWYRAFYARNDMRAYSLAQIAAYQEAARNRLP